MSVGLEYSVSAETLDDISAMIKLCFHLFNDKPVTATDMNHNLLAHFD